MINLQMIFMQFYINQVKKKQYYNHQKKEFLHVTRMGLFDFITNYQFQNMLNIDNQFDSRIAPKTLLKQLENKSNLKKFIKIINKEASSSYKTIRRLHLCNMLLLYSDSFYQAIVEEINIPLCQDEWLNNEFIKPYKQFMYRCATEPQMFKRCKKSIITPKPQQIFQQLFFLINSFKILFKSINKLSLFGKFYKSKSPKVFQGVIEMIAIQSKQLYFCFKNIMIMILQDTQRYLLTSQHEQIIKNILINDLAYINQQMKMLLLGKQFYPYGKAIGIKLFRVDQATKQLENTMRGIVTDHLQTNRRMEKEYVEEKLFNHKSGFNVKFFEETLSAVRGSAPIIGMFGKNRLNAGNKPQSEEVVESDDDDQDDPEMTNSKKLAETNESNLNKVDNI